MMQLTTFEFDIKAVIINFGKNEDRFLASKKRLNISFIRLYNL